MTKSELRGEVRERLSSLAPGERRAAGEEIGRGVWTLPEVAGAGVLLLYASLPTEVPTDGIAAEARRRGIVVTYPRCLRESREMVLHRVDSEAELHPSDSYGIREPVPQCPVVRLEEIDAALVPGMAWDRRGGRLGRGAGYYDRVFSDPRWRAFRCGLLFAVQEVPRVPVEPHDVPLEAVVTEVGVWRAR